MGKGKRLAKNRIRLLDAKNVFARVLDEAVREMGILDNVTTQKQLDGLINECINECYASAWSEFIEWVLYENDAKARTLDHIRASGGIWGEAAGRLTTLY